MLFYWARAKSDFLDAMGAAAECVQYCLDGNRISVVTMETREAQ